MFIKQRTGTNIYGALKYNSGKVGVSSVLLTNNVLESAGNEPTRYWMKSFQPYLAANIQTEKPVVHISLNPHPEDKLNPEDYRTIAGRYMDEMGYGEQPYVVFLHEDIDRKHLHVVTTCVGLDGKKINLDFDKRRSQRIRDKMIKDYGLTPFDGRTQKGKFSRTLDYARSDIKAQIKSIALNIIDQYKFGSLADYNAVMNCYNIEAWELRGTAGKNGTPYRGLMYSALDGDGNRCGVPIKSSDIGDDLQLKNLDGLFARHAPVLKNLDNRKALAEKINGVIGSGREPGTHTRQEVKALLESSGISVIFRDNDQGRLYGVTFVDHDRKEVYKGSALGKEFSANRFQRMFEPVRSNEISTAPGELQSSPEISPDFPQQETVIIPESMIPEEHESAHTVFKESGREGGWEYEYESSPFTPHVLSGLFDKPLPPVYEYQDPELRKRKKKKRKRRR